MAHSKTEDDGARFFVIVGGVNDGVRYSAPAAKREVRLIKRFRDRIAFPEGDIEVVPA